MIPTRDYVYDAVLHKIVDGDTVWLDVDLGGHVYARWRLRLLGYDSPSARTPEGRRAAVALSAFLWGPDGGLPEPLVIETVRDKQDVYGRLLVRVWRKRDGVEVTPHMIEHGYGVPWDGTGGHPAQPGAEVSRSVSADVDGATS